MATILGVTDIIKDEHTYNVELGHVSVEREKGNASIKIGGTDKEKFVPNINASKWNNEAFLNINYPETVITTEQETFIDDKIEITADGLTHRYFKKDDKSLKHDIVIPSKPLSNHFTFNLTFSENLRFDHQDTLEADWLRFSENGTKPHFGCNTLQEYEDKFNRPDNIINSYAVYGRSKNNKYLTGKFCHIERVKVIDAKLNEIWAEQLIEPVSSTSATWTITIDQAWLDNAVYPIVIDPVMGYNTVGGASVAPGADLFFGCRYAMGATAGTIDDINVYGEKTTGSPEIIAGVYEDSSGAIGGSDLISSGSSAIIAPVAPDWMTDSGLTGSLTASIDYWIGVEAESGFEFYYDTATAGYEDTEVDWSNAWNGVLPDPAPESPDDYAYEISAYVNYTESGTTLIVAAADSAGAIDNVTLTQAHILGVQALSGSGAIDNVALTQAHLLAVQALLSSGTLDNIDLIQNYLLSVQELSGDGAIDNVAVTQKHILAVQALLTSGALDNVALIQKHLLAVQALLSSGTLDNTDLIQNYLLSVQELSGTGAINNVAVTQKHILAVQALLTSGALDNVALIQKHLLAVQALLSSGNIDNVELSLAVLLSVAEALSAGAIDNVELTQKHVLAVDALLSGGTLDAINLIVSTLLVVSDLLTSGALDTTVLTQQHVLTVAEVLSAGTVDSAALTQKHILVLNSLLSSGLIDNINFNIASGLIFITLTQAVEYTVAVSEATEHGISLTEQTEYNIALSETGGG